MQEQPKECEALYLTQQNCVEELTKLAIHCKEAALQLREMLDLPFLEGLEQPGSNLKPIEQLEEPDPKLERIKRVSLAAAEGFLLDQEDLLETRNVVAETFDSRDMRTLKRSLLSVKPEERALSTLDKIREPLQLYEQLERIASSALIILDSQ
jgi:hypothetical protein